MDFARPYDFKEAEKIKKYQALARVSKKSMEEDC